jgi:hypothetical protein
MSILTEDEYREIFETVDKYSDTVSRLTEESMDIDRVDRPEDIEELNDVGAVLYRSDEDNEWYAVASSMGEEALGHQENGGSLDQYLTVMMWREEKFEEVYSS